MNKRHTTPPGIELNQWEFQLVMGKLWEHKDAIVRNIFCMCKQPSIKLADYKIYLDNINDIVLRGRCSGCNRPSSRHIETGENTESCMAANRIRKMKTEVK